ncbi:exported hypothetical protein [Bradyrhizobium oligotrophicum S58]|uniref:Uncharacterized protein n=1 Tax=Bradyrhizobium oligotrophicum S58 TaxID=1245469 RepID=M4ZFR8_9BRAD|nr:hypothetical protein [Bradyrhizobium oligotrophicum]BAM92371.1 exported hypothetical protein [Bradyrhizobium oligotrophicum S58]
MNNPHSSPIALLLCLLAIILTTVRSDGAFAQTDDRCSIYFVSTTPEKGNPAVIQEAYLADINTAVPCLIQVIERLGGQINSPAVEPDVKSRLLTATGALRAIMTRLDSASNLNNFITLFRERNNINVISALTYAARSDNKDLRLSSTLLLGNVIDNRFVCVPLTQLNDPEFMKAAEAPSGRANLLGVVSVVAPWAYKENYENIDKTRDYIGGQIGREDSSSMKNTLAILDNIQTRLKSQTNNSNKTVSLNTLDRAIIPNCRKYVQAYTPKLTSPENVNY